MKIYKILAEWRGEDAREFRSEKVRGYTFISTPGHGYLAVGSEDNGYSDALAIARGSNYSFILDGGLVFLEEDCDAPAFLKLGMDNRSPVLATDFMESMGIHVVRIKQ